MMIYETALPKQRDCVEQRRGIKNGVAWIAARVGGPTCNAPWAHSDGNWYTDSFMDMYFSDCQSLEVDFDGITGIGVWGRKFKHQSSPTASDDPFGPDESRHGTHQGFMDYLEENRDK